MDVLFNSFLLGGVYIGLMLIVQAHGRIEDAPTRKLVIVVCLMLAAMCLRVMLLWSGVISAQTSVAITIAKILIVGYYTGQFVLEHALRNPYLRYRAREIDINEVFERLGQDGEMHIDGLHMSQLPRLRSLDPPPVARIYTEAHQPRSFINQYHRYDQVIRLVRGSLTVDGELVVDTITIPAYLVHSVTVTPGTAFTSEFFQPKPRRWIWS